MSTKKGVLDLHQMKRAGEKITWLTAYDYPSATFEEAAGIDMILVGDSLGMCVYGYPGTVPVTMDQCIVHCEAVRRGAPNTFVVGDMPLGSYQASDEDAVRNAIRFLKEAERRRDQARGRRAHGQPRQGDPRRRHRRLRPHRPHAAELRSAGRPQGAGPHPRVRQAGGRGRPCPLRGGRPAPACRGRAAGGRRLHPRRALHPRARHRRWRGRRRAVLIVSDVLGTFQAFTPKFVKKYADLAGVSTDALREYMADVRGGTFPEEQHCYHMLEGEAERFAAWAKAESRTPKGPVMHSLAEGPTPPGPSFTPADRVARLGTRRSSAVSTRRPRSPRGTDHLPVPLRRPRHPDGGAGRRGDRPGDLRRKPTYCPEFPACRAAAQALAADVAAARGVAYAAENVSVQPGGKPVIGKWLMAAMNTGDEVLYPNPGFPIYASFIEFVGGVAVPYGYVDDGERFRVDLDAMERRIAPRTRLLILNDLHNPTAAECTAEELERIAEIALRHDLLVLSDEAYFDVRFEGASRSLVLPAGHAGAHGHPVHVQQEVRDDRLAPGRRHRTDADHRRHHAHEREHGVVPQSLRPVRRSGGHHRRPERAARDAGEAQGPPRRRAAPPGRDARRALSHAAVHVLPVSGRLRRRPPDRLRRSRGLPAPPPRPHRPPRESALAIRDLSARATGSTALAGTVPAAEAPLAGTVTRAAGVSERTAVLMWRMCSGVVPQQPPTRRTPLLMKRRAYDAMYSGEQR